ncbi:MAG: hypothetical protein H0T53_09865 [Herpetosiphonaceae bacterium]|nr:hypothetical protein [Herpetosiphonaceae bacterium]
MSEFHLRVFTDRSELIEDGNIVEIFVEGKMNVEAKERYNKISQFLKKGYLDLQIDFCKNSSNDIDISSLTVKQMHIVDDLINSITSEVGRALIGLTILQLCIKDIEPLQSIRLHKGSASSATFSWQDGISMRTLSAYITPILRKHELLKLNADGFMMTRTLAENYPYSKVYKASIKGARHQWIAIVEELEVGSINAKATLQYMLSKLLNNAEDFKKLANNTIFEIKRIIASGNFDNSYNTSLLLKKHMNVSDHAARIMEISMHSLIQALQQHGLLNDNILVPLSQMRSANKKHGNIGDIEIKNGDHIVETWDAKFGKSYLRDELDELNDKLSSHLSVEKAGFVTSVVPDRLEELTILINDIEQIHGTSIEILLFEDWVERQFAIAISSGGITEQALANDWLLSYVESLAQKRPHIAPIDEPCYRWLEILYDILRDY